MRHTKNYIQAHTVNNIRKVWENTNFSPTCTSKPLYVVLAVHPRLDAQSIIVIEVIEHEQVAVDARFVLFSQIPK